MAEACVAVAGHLCLDVIPTMSRSVSLEGLLKPGSLVEVGPALLSAGGAVSNTGLALHRLGVPVRLIGKVGDDLFGSALRRILAKQDPGLEGGLLVAGGQCTSYTLVISPPGLDRMFLHCPGANDTFCAADVPLDQLAGVRLFHFGYPPLMRRFYANDGAELEALLRRVRQCGASTSLDMCMPDPASEGGRVDWRRILQRVLPHVDIFLPSFWEILFMLDRRRFDELRSPGRPDHRVRQPHSSHGPRDAALLAELSGQLLDMGAAVVGFKLGDRGLYIRTTGVCERLSALRAAAGKPLDDWLGRELMTPCFEAEVVGTTGCGDCTIAGFLLGVLRGLPLEAAMTAAAAVGACSVEQADATSGVPTWEAVQARIRCGWKKRALMLSAPGWHWDAASLSAIGPHDRATPSPL